MEDTDVNAEEFEPHPYEGAFEAADPLTREEVLEVIKAHRTWVDSPRLRDYLTKLYLAAGG